MNQYAILSQSPNFTQVTDYIRENKIAHEVHLNRTRFWIPESMHESFLSKFGAVCNYVHPNEDLMTGHRIV